MDIDQAIRDRLHMGYKAVARDLGVTEYAVRTRMVELGLKSTHAVSKQKAATRRAGQPTDAELIAEALAAGKVTYLPSGQACGISAWESRLWTAGAGPIGWRYQNTQRNKNAGTLK